MKKTISLFIAGAMAAAMMPAAMAVEMESGVTLEQDRSFSKVAPYGAAFSSAGAQVLNSYFTVSGNTYLDSAWTDYSRLYDGERYADHYAGWLNFTDSGTDYTFTANNDAAFDVSGIVLYARNIRNNWEDVSGYRVYLTDTSGNSHYVYDMNYLASDTYAVKITIPASVGAITGVGIDPYTKAEFSEKIKSGYTSDRVVCFDEFVIYGVPHNAPQATITKGSSFADYQSYASSFESIGGAKLNGYFTVSGDNVDVSGGTAPGKYEAFYDGDQYEGANLWGSSDRSVDYVWTAAEALDVDGIALYTFEQGEWAARYSDSVSLYRIYVIDENGGKHYVYDMNERATSEYALKIEIPDAYGAITAVGIDPYTTSEIAAKGYEQNDQAIRMCEFVIYGTDPNTPEEPEPEFFEMTKTGDAVKNADGTSNVGFTTDAVNLSEYRGIAFKLVKLAGGEDIKGINLDNTALPYTGTSEVILGVQLDNIGAEYDPDQCEMKLVTVEVE